MLTKCFQNMRMQIFRSNVPTGERFQQIPQKCSVSSPNCCKVPRGRFFPPHLCVGSCLCFCIPSAPPPVLLRLLRHLLLHITLSHTTLSHTAHTHTNTQHYHTQLCHTPLTFVLRGRRDTYGTGLGLATSTIVSRGRRGTWRHQLSFCVAGVALEALGWVWWRAWAPVVARDAAALCVAGVAAWHLATSTFVSRGRHGTWRRRRSICVAGVAIGDINFGFARQAWRLWHWAGFGGALGRR